MTKKAGRRGAESTAREDILRVARELFAQNGFEVTSLRAVANRAGVDVALISYYFGNKRGLFVAALAMPVDPAEVVRATVPGPRNELGGRLATAFLTALESPETGPALHGFLRTAVSDETTAGAFGEFASTVMIPLITHEAAVSRDTARALATMLFGMATMRYLIAVPAFREQSTAELIAAFGPRLQALIDVDDDAS